MSQNKTMILDLNSGSVPRQLIRFALPLLLSGVLQTLYNMVDMIIVGRVIGSAGQSAVSIGGDVMNMLMLISMGFSNAGGICISQYVGAKQYDKMSKMIGTMFSFLMLCAAVIGTLCLVLGDSLLSWLNTPTEAFDHARAYMLTCIAGIFFIYGYNIVSSILRGMGDSKRPFAFIAIAAVLNLILDILFIAVLDMEVFGAALATVIGQSVSFILALIYLYKKREQFGFDFKLKSFRIFKEEFVALTKLGLPLALQFGAIQVSMMLVNSWINSYGVIATAVTGIGMKISSAVNVFSHALSSATSAMLGQAFGAKLYKRVSNTLFHSFVLNIIISAVGSAVVVLFPRAVFGIFNSEAEVLDLAMSYVPIAVLMLVGSGLRAPMMALINSSGHSKLNLVVALVDGIIARIGFAVLLGDIVGLGVLGYWYGQALAGIVPFFIGGVFYLSGSWKKKSHVVK